MVCKNMARDGIKPKTSKLARKRKKRALGRLVLFFVFFVSIVVGLSFLSSVEFLSIKNVEVVGVSVLNSEEIGKLVFKEIDSKKWGLFANSNAFLYPKRRITGRILDSNNRIADAKVSLDGLSDLKIEIQERMPFGIWCSTPDLPETLIESEENLASETPMSKPEDCFYFDDTGFIFEKIAGNESNENNDYLFYYGGNIEKTVGSFLTTGEIFQNLQTFLKLLTSLSVRPVKIFLEGTVEAKIVLDSGTEIILGLGENSEKSFENLVTLISEPEFQNSKDGLSMFENIDLSFGHKVLYRLR